MKPTIVCLCGSTRFKDAFVKAQLDETLAGRIVLTIGCNMKSDTEIFGHMSEAEREVVKAKLDKLHLEKILLADEVLILNVGGYVGESTARELAYARGLGKVIRFLDPEQPSSPAPEQALGTITHPVGDSSKQPPSKLTTTGGEWVAPLPATTLERRAETLEGIERKGIEIAALQRGEKERSEG